MKKAILVSLGIAGLLIILSTTGFRLRSSSQDFFTDSLEADRMKYMNQVLESIKGKEKWPADSVFKNLKVIVGKSSISAEHLLWMMNYGWSAELGVSCGHCHLVGRWDSDSLGSKEIARGMWKMRVLINSEILPSITGKDYWQNPKVSCITCHRGKPVPDAF